jgi:L-asparaginase/Glu-tRNA(Gln) amidotransferase subunit D
MTRGLDCRYALLNLGGTIGEIYDPSGLSQRASARMLLSAAGLPEDWPAYDVALIDSADMTFDMIGMAGAVIAADRSSAGFVLCCGTDLLEEIAYAASLLLPADRPIIVTAAALPASEPGTDGPANLRRAAALLASGLASGTMVVMGDAIFPAAGIVKVEPQAVQPFATFDGPIGRFRGGAPGSLRVPVAEDMFRSLQPRDCRARVAILHECLGGTDPFVDPAALDGLVVAGAGAGGLHGRTLAMLRERYLPVMPVVLSTRCPFGFAANVDLLKHDLSGARADGFRLDGYLQLSAVQARIRLILEIGLTIRKNQRP